MALALPAGAVSLVGDAMAFVALTLRVHDSGAGPYAVTLLLVCFSLPVVAGMGLAGQAADLLDPRLVAGGGALVQVLACLGLAAWDGLGVTFALVLVLQTGFAFTSPVWDTVLVRAVGEDAVGRLVSTRHALAAVAAPAGAGIGGLLVQVRGDALVFLLDALTYAGLLGVAVSLRGRPERDPAHGRTSLLPREGLRAVRSDRVVWVLVLGLLPFVVTLEGMNVVEVFLVRDVLGASPAGFGLAQAVMGVGAVLGALLALLLGSETARLRAVVGCLGALALFQIGQGMSPGLAAFIAWSAALGVANAVLNAALFTMLLHRIAATERGRALAFLNGMARSCTMLALVLGGTAASILGPRCSFVVAGAGGLVVFTWSVSRLRVSLREGLGHRRGADAREGARAVEERDAQVHGR